MQTHAFYLATIVVLIIVAAYAMARAARAQRIAQDIEKRFGVQSGNASFPRVLPEPLRPYNPQGLLRALTYEERRKEVDALIESAQQLGEFEAGTQLANACGKALKGGKRVRAIILIEVARAVSKLHPYLPPVDAAEAALGIEYLHSASLVIDDSPAFDNDVMRRGEPAVHVEFGAGVAQMAALSITSAALQNMCRQVDWLRANCPEIKNPDRIGTGVCSEISRALGCFGTAGGQCMDITEADRLVREHGNDALLELVYRKTATLFEIAVVTGWLIAGGSPTVENVDTLRCIGKHIGIAFQVADDLGDADKDAVRASQGKPGWNFANYYGKDLAEKEVDSNLRSARLLLERQKCWTPLWDEIFTQIKSMSH